MTHEEAIDQIVQALKDRYHVPTLNGLGAIPGAVAVARDGDMQPLIDVLDGREMYRWQGDVDEALEALKSANPVVHVADDEEAPLAQEPKPRRTR